MVELQVRNAGRRRPSTFSAGLLSRLHVEKVEGGLSIAGCALAANCHLILLVFAFFFLLAGAVLTALAYRPTTNDEGEGDPRQRQLGANNRRRLHEQTRVVGPIFLLLGLAMLTFGAVLCGLAWKVSKGERERRLECSLHGIHRQSSYRILPSIAQSVPIGIFVDTSFSLPSIKESRSSISCPVNASRDDTGEVTKDELPCTISVPVIASPIVFSRDQQIFRHIRPSMSSSSDQPFGSILSLIGDGTGEVASFPPAPTLQVLRADSRESDIVSLGEDNSSRRSSSNTPVTLPVIHVAEFASESAASSHPGTENEDSDSGAQ